MQPSRNKMDKLTPEIALVVCTRNRADKLQGFFDAVRRLKVDFDWELIIVNNGSTDQTEEYLKQFAAGYPGQLRLLFEPETGVARGRNRGWRASQAPIIAFIDDDCYPEQTFLTDLKQAFARATLGVIGGRILLFDPTDAPVTINDSTQEIFLRAGQFVYAGFLQGANLAFRRQALMDIDGFDQYLGPGTPFICEDADLVLRVLASGWEGKYDPGPTIYHHHRRKPGPEIQRLLQGYDAGRGAIYLKCLLYLPQRWRCLLHWLKALKNQSGQQSVREFRAAIHYFGYQLKRNPNATYRRRS